MNPSNIMIKRGIAWFIIYPFNLLNQLILKFSLRYGGRQAKEVERFLKFAVVGAIGAVIDFGVLNLLQSSVLSPAEPHLALKVALATGTAFTSAVTSNFVWNRYWTYPDSRSRSIQQQLVQFFIVNAVGLAFRLIWVRGLFNPMGNIGVDTFRWLGVIESMDGTATKQLGTNIAQFFAIWIVMIWNFFVNRYWTYNDVE
jgi:putative flippase GtrA